MNPVTRMRMGRGSRRPGRLHALLRNGAATFAMLGATAALAADPDPAQAQALVQAASVKAPDTVAAHLALGRAYYVLGQYAEAKIEFETVLRFDNLPQDLLSQVEIYNRAAAEALDEGRPLTAFGYAETGIGGYRVNSTRGTDFFGGGDRHDAFLNGRAGGGLNYALANGYAIDASLDYRFRSFDNADTRNDSDLRWRLAGSRSFGENNLAVGVRGRNSYRGDGDFRNDAGIFTDYRYRVDPDNQITLGAEYLRRRYPEGRLRERSRTAAEASAGWIHSLLDGAGSLTINARGGQYSGENRPDGSSDFFGASVALDFTVNKRLGWGTFAWWERDSYSNERVHFHPDALDNGVLQRRKDNLYEVGAYLVWEFAPTWTLRPELLWIRDQSNALGVNYSATEYWINVRKSF
ncbi:surface lipoprotein assembly modifier [Variovorax sp. J22P168]|uniref:surface lipoprotein assembly modifier n=1 Tax=Variovorax jilinensis TaxID=3053513 RepID=UPI0025749C19|nr:surface lipoprotein assembly modifier [Variovorax sp. J22P168]MDM0011291.1 surface lipoprotein assembly modifier [Variovorax sp. J22P168]